MKRMLKIVSVLMIVMIVMVIFSNTTLAAINWKSSIDTMANASDKSSASQSAQNIVGSIIAVTRVIAVGIAIIMLVVLAMKYMMAAPGDKADIKKHAVIYVVGAIVLFAAQGILGIISQFAGSIS